MRIQDLYQPGFSFSRGISLTSIEDLPETARELMNELPRCAMTNCSRLVISLLTGRTDLEPCLKGGEIPDTVPFFTASVWNHLIYWNNWEQEKKNLRTMMRHPIDCNAIGMCGLNLYHMYIIRALYEWDENQRRLLWWIGHPMIDINAPLMDLRGRRSRHIRVLHPVEWILSLPEHENRDRLLVLLFSRGLSIAHAPKDLCASILPSAEHLLALRRRKDYIPTENERHLLRRLCRQWSPSSLGDADRIEHRIQHRGDMDLFRLSRQFEYPEDAHLTPTPQMNDLLEIPPSHCLSYQNFYFHGGYMDMILKTHIFPFTGNPIESEIIDAWLDLFDKEPDRFMREELVLSEIIKDYPEYLSRETYLYPDPFSMGIHKIHDWMIGIYPYTRILMLVKKDERVLHYLCREMARGVARFSAFRALSVAMRRVEEEEEEDKGMIDWGDRFLWAAYESIMEHGFAFSNRMEELLSRLEMFRVVRNLLIPKVFHILYPTFHDFQDSANPPLLEVLRVFQEEHDAALYHTFLLLRQLSEFFSPPPRRG